MKLMTIRMISVFSVILLSGCSFNLPAPPRHADLPHPVVPSNSTLAVPIVLNVDAVREKVIEDLRSEPIFKGRSQELSVKMFGEQITIKEIPTTIIDVAGKAETCASHVIVETVVEQVLVPVHIAGCVITFWKPDCWTKVLKSVSHDVKKTVQACTPAVAAVTHIAMIPTTFIAENIVDTSAWVNYRGDLDELTFSMKGNAIVVHARVDVPVSVDVKEKVFNASLKVKGALACTSKIAADATVNVQLVPTVNSIRVKADVQGFAIDVKQFCIPGAVQLAQAWSMSSLESAAISALVKSVIEKKLQKAVSDAVAKSANDLPVGEEISAAVTKLQGAYAISKDLWLKVEPKKVYISQLVGATVGGQTLSFTAGVDTDLSAIYGTKPVVAPATVPVPVSLGVGGNGFKLVPRGTIQVGKIKEVALSEIKKAAGGKFEQYGFTLDQLDVYQSAERIVIQVKVKGTKFARPSGSLYLSGKPVYNDAKRSVSIEDLRFTVESKNWLLKNAAAVAEIKIEDAISKQLEFNFGENLDKLLTRNGTFEVPVSNGKIKGVVTSVKMKSIWMQDDALNVELLVEGTSQLNLSL